MNRTQEHLILKDAVETYGDYDQIEMLIEECSEVILAAQKLKRCGNFAHPERSAHLMEEIADVSIMIDQMKYIFDEEKINAYREAKLHRLEQRLKEYKEKLK